MSLKGVRVETTAAEEEFRSTVRNLNIFDGLALLIALGLVGVGFFIGTIGGGIAAGSTSSVDFTITPDDQVRPLAPGKTAEFPIYINNTNNYGVWVSRWHHHQRRGRGSGRLHQSRQRSGLHAVSDDGAHHGQQVHGSDVHAALDRQVRLIRG
jgi:hypothetical protein